MWLSCLLALKIWTVRQSVHNKIHWVNEKKTIQLQHDTFVFFMDSSLTTKTSQSMISCHYKYLLKTIESIVVTL